MFDLLIKHYPYQYTDKDFLMKQKIKREKEEDWAKAKNFIPKLKEVIIYDCNEGPKIKIGNGKDNVNDLPFIDSTSFIVQGDGECCSIVLKEG